MTCKTIAHPFSRLESPSASSGSHPSADTVFVTCNGSNSEALWVMTVAKSSQTGSGLFFLFASVSSVSRTNGSFFTASRMVAKCMGSISCLLANSATLLPSAFQVLKGVLSMISSFRRTLQYPLRIRDTSSASHVGATAFSALPTSAHIFFVVNAFASADTRHRTWKEAAGPPCELQSAVLQAVATLLSVALSTIVFAKRLASTNQGSFE
mmetsp:Transcript_4770/g.15923  ORF Transcript_4770/g.15923 Transcript_4770/m.15923 type:complete len:210 (-) Transcript_4770:1734-2363(-)